MRCRLCARWNQRLLEMSEAWERAHSNESELWSQEPLRNRELIEQAWAAAGTDPAESFRLHLEAAEAGSAWAMEQVAWQYESGSVVAADPEKAGEYYCRAINAGSWMATLYYAGFLESQGRHDEGREVLEGGLAADFVPACFWLVWFRYGRCGKRERREEILPILEHAAGRGHPRAQVLLARLMIFGKFGLRRIPAGIALAVRLGLRAAREADADSGEGPSPASPSPAPA